MSASPCSGIAGRSFIGEKTFISLIFPEDFFFHELFEMVLIYIQTESYLNNNENFMCMGSIADINITKLEKGKISANLGDAHEHIVAGILIRLGFDVGIVDVSGTPYDLMIVGFKNPDGEKIVLRAQIKTASTSISFVGGSRGGVDRSYKSGVKTYKYNLEHSDLILGIDKTTLDIYVIPTKFITAWGSSKSLSKMQILKNNWDILLNWNETFLDGVEANLPS